jgi:hypothetical protein
MAQIPLYDAETDELVNEAALKKQEDERLRQRPRKSITEMRLAGGLAGGEFMRDYTSTPEYRQRAIRKSLERAQSVGEQNLATTEKRLSEQKASLDAEQRADEQQVQAGVERAINDAFQRAYEENKAMGLSEEAALVMGRQAANDARAFFESSTAGTPVQLQRPVDDPVASGEAMQQALEQKYAGLESLHGARISQLRGLGSQLEEQYAAERGSALAEQSVLARQTEDETDIRRAYREQEKARIETENVNRQIRAKAKEKTQLDIDEAVGEVVNFKIDPKRFYKGTGSAIASAIAVALGEFGSKLAGGPNTALSIINRAVDRDIDAQKTELQNLKYGASAAGNAYKRLLDRHGDAEKAERLAREQALTYVKMQLGEVADKYKVPLQASKLGQLISGIEKQRIANAMTLSDKEFESRIAAAKLRPAKVGGKMEQKDTEFFQDMAEFYDGIGELKASFEQIGGTYANQAMRWALSGESKEKFFQSLPDFLAPDFAEKIAQFGERGRLLSKTLSKMKEGGKISDMDLLFYMERMPLSTDNDNMIRYKMGVLETLARNALRMRRDLTQGEFDKFNRELKEKMTQSGVTSATGDESARIKKALGIKD